VWMDARCVGEVQTCAAVGCCADVRQDCVGG